MADFHFIRPFWLCALLLLPLIIYLLKRLQVSHSGWQKILPAHLSAKLIDANTSHRQVSIIAPCIIAIISIIALAGPAWQKLPQPVYNVKKGSIIIMDMSNSMYATDLTPNRLTRARYKAIDLLDRLNEGDVGLVVYAGDSFIISPLTEDINNIKLLLPALSPELMPVPGSNPLLALNMANDMLLNAGHIEGDIYWLTDEADNYDAEEITPFLSTIKHRVSILGIGTAAGAPITMPNGQLLKDDKGAIVIPHLKPEKLKHLARQGRGAYHRISNNANDLDYLLQQAETSAELKEKEQQYSEGDQFKEAGPYLLLILLPLLLPYFRRGNLLSIGICSLFIFHGDHAWAQTQPDTAKATLTDPAQPQQKTSTSFWQDMWQTKDQQGQKHYNQENYQAAAQHFKNPLWQGSSHYKNGDFDKALEAFKQDNSAAGLYNQGNSLAKLGKLDEAISAYDNALKKSPNLTEAQTNKAMVEQLLKQQQQQENQSGENGEQGQEKNNQEKQNNDEQGSNGEQQQDQQGEPQTGDNQQNSQENASDNASESEQNSDNQQSDKNQQSGQENTQQEDDSAQSQQQSDEQPKEESTSQANKADDASDEEAQKAAQAANAELTPEQQEQLQKHQKLLNKVTDDPYLLLRNKMRLEYQKRRYENSGVDKKW